MSAVAAFPIPPVVKTVTVRCAPDVAFRVFTADIGRWYPLAIYSVRPAVDCALEPFVGGRLFEVDADGRETLWGSVTEWNPPHRLRLAWHARASEAEAQEIDISFRPVSGGTEVRLAHDGWERLQVEAAEWRDRYDGGWVEVFERRYKAFADRAA